MSAIKIALVQKKAIPNDKERNLSLAVQYIREASYLGADIVLFPEMWSNGYAPPFEGAFDNPFNHDFEKERKEWELQKSPSGRKSYLLQSVDCPDSTEQTQSMINQVSARKRTSAELLPAFSYSCFLFQSSPGATPSYGEL